MTTLADRIRAKLDAETERLHALPPFPWKLNPDDDTEVYAADDVVLAEAWALSTNQQRRVAEHIALHDPERELRMVAAHRKIVDDYESANPDKCRDPEDKAYEAGVRDGLLMAVRAIASTYGIL